jgi:predicted nucleotidyltransferase
VRQDEHQQGREVAEQAVSAARLVFGDRVSSAHLIGSLAHGGFIADVSDVDVALILGNGVLRDSDPADERRIREVARRVEQLNDSSLARRLSVFWTDEQSLRDGRPTGRLPAIDWLDLVDNGEATYGPPLPSATPRPTYAQLVRDSVDFAVRKWRLDPTWSAQIHDGAGLVRQGRRAASKAALFPVRFLYTLTTGGTGGSHLAADWYVATRRPASELVQAAHRWRTHGIDDVDEAARLLDDQLVGLYHEFEATYRPRLVEQDQQALADELAATIARL